MVKYFHFHDGENHFDEALVSSRCKHINNITNHRCRKRCLIGLDKCWIHLLTDHSLRIKRSAFLTRKNIQGVGLFVQAKKGTKKRTKIFKKNEVICAYNGNVINHETLNERYEDKTAPYTVELKNNTYEDAAIYRGVGSLINHTSQSKSNCRLSLSNKNRIQIKASKHIYDGTELLTNYGKDYKFNENGVQTTTNNKRLSI